MIVQMTYWINVMPGEQGENVMMSANGGMLVGSWACEVDSDSTTSMLKALRLTHADPLVKLEKENSITGSQSMKLHAMRQFRWVIDLLKRKKFDSGVTYVALEPMESQLLTIAHNIRVEYIGQ